MSGDWEKFLFAFIFSMKLTGFLSKYEQKLYRSY